MKLVSEPDKGIYDAINKGISRATGDIVGLMHSDDVFANQEVLSKVAALQLRCFVIGVLVSIADPSFYARIRPFTFAIMFLKNGLYDTSFRIAGDYDACFAFFGLDGFNCILT